MKRIEEYKDIDELGRDVQAAGSALNRDQRLQLYAAFEEECLIRKTLTRIREFIKDRKMVYRTDLYRSLRLDRVGSTVMEEALARLYEEGHVEVHKNTTPQRGRRPVFLLWCEEAAPAIDIKSIIEKVKSFPDLTPVLPAGTTQAEPSLEIANEVMQTLLAEPSGIKLVRPTPESKKKSALLAGFGR